MLSDNQLLIDIAKASAATDTRTADMHRRLFEEGDGGVIGKIERMLEAKADVADFNALKTKVDGLTWKAAWSSGVGATIVFSLKYGWTKFLHH